MKPLDAGISGNEPDAALLALKPEADEINAVCAALARRVNVAEAQVSVGAPCPHLRGAEAAEEAAAKVWIDLHDRIAAMRARTLAGIQFKARFSPTPWLDPVIMQSIIEDLLALVGG